METALCLIETNQPVFPLDIVRQMREQRLGMIQTAVSKNKLDISLLFHHLDYSRVNINSHVGPFYMLMIMD